MQSDLYCPRLYFPPNSIICGFWGQILVRPTYMKYSQSSIIRGFSKTFWDQNLVRPSTADNRGLTVVQQLYYRLFFAGIYRLIIVTTEVIMPIISSILI